VSWGVEWSKTALKDVKRLDASVAERVREAIDRLAVTGQGDVKKLKGGEDVLRLRVGDWRVFFRLVPEAGLIQVVRVLHRSDAYR
jgi:mRNA interferase RelE/StbE